MANDNTDFLRFSAYSIKELITRKLSQDTKFTDQIYPGSNLAILIDAVSYMFQCMMFSLNAAAGESMWSDTQIYENINRLCQFLGYNPHGMNPAKAQFTLSAEPLLNIENDDEASTSIHVLPYSSLDTGKSDSKGRRIYYSTVSQIDLQYGSTKEVTLYNGKWKLYGTVFTAKGDAWETFTLDGLKSDASVGQYISSNYIHVYVKHRNGEIRQFMSTDAGLLKMKINKYETDSQEACIPRLYTGRDEIFSIRLDENKTYVITFGDGTLGKKLDRGDQLYIFYMESNGPEGVLDPKELSDVQLKQSPAAMAMSNERWMEVFNQSTQAMDDFIENSNFLRVVKATNTTDSIPSVDEETVEEIRDFAPHWFKMGNRLVTKSDYEYFLRNSPFFRGNFIDVKVMNNWEYMGTYYKWLYKIGLEKYGDGRKYLQSSTLLQRPPRKYIDPADANNIYVWCKGDSDSNFNQDFYDGLKDIIYPVKDLTHEPIFIEPINVNFRICACGDEEKVKEMFNIGPDYAIVDEDYDENIRRTSQNYIEVTLSDSVLYTNTNITVKIQNIIRDFFNRKNLLIGQTIDFNVLQNRILQINGISKIRTIFKNADDPDDVKIRNGLCFATWTDDSNIITPGDDLEISNVSRTLEPFQFASLVAGNEIAESIKVIKHSSDVLNKTLY